MRGTPRGVSLSCREKAARRSTQAQLSALTIRQRAAYELDQLKDEMPAVLRALLDKAKKWDVPAAREYRAWHDQALGTLGQAPAEKGAPDQHKPYTDMTPEERTLARAAVIRRIAELEASQPTADTQENDEPA